MFSRWTGKSLKNCFRLIKISLIWLESYTVRQKTTFYIDILSKMLYYIHTRSMRVNIFFRRKFPMSTKTKVVTTPRSKFSFATCALCKKAYDAVHKNFPQLMISYADANLFVQSRRSTIYDLEVRSFVESMGGSFVTKIG